MRKLQAYQGYTVYVLDRPFRVWLDTAVVQPGGRLNRRQQFGLDGSSWGKGSEKVRGQAVLPASRVSPEGKDRTPSSRRGERSAVGRRVPVLLPWGAPRDLTFSRARRSRTRRARLSTTGEPGAALARPGSPRPLASCPPVGAPLGLADHRRPSGRLIDAAPTTSVKPSRGAAGPGRARCRIHRHPEAWGGGRMSIDHDQRTIGG